MFEIFLNRNVGNYLSSSYVFQIMYMILTEIATNQQNWQPT